MSLCRQCFYGCHSLEIEFFHLRTPYLLVYLKNEDIYIYIFSGQKSRLTSMDLLNREIELKRVIERLLTSNDVWEAVIINILFIKYIEDKETRPLKKKTEIENQNPEARLAYHLLLMAKTLDKSKKRKRVKSKKTDKRQKIDKSAHHQQQPESSTPYSSSSSDSSDSDSEKEFDPEELRELLRPYSKEQLVDLVCSAAQIGSSIYSAVVEAADRDVTHRKIFVYGLPWETTRETLAGVFEGYGEIEECTVVIDKVTGKAKGFGFVMFKTRKGAREALKEPKKRILNRTATCQLASMGPAASGKGQDQAGPVKMSLGSMANQGQPQQQQAQGQHVFTGGGMAASPFMLGNQYHPVYGTGMLGNPALAAAGGAYMYPMLAGALSHGGLGSGALSHDLLQSSQMGGIGGDPGVSAGLSVLGSYFRGQSLPSAYPDSDTGKRASGKDSDAGGSFHGYSNYSWYAHCNLLWFSSNACAHIVV